MESDTGIYKNMNIAVTFHIFFIHFFQCVQIEHTLTLFGTSFLNMYVSFLCLNALDHKNNRTVRPFEVGGAVRGEGRVYPFHTYAHIFSVTARDCHLFIFLF